MKQLPDDWMDSRPPTWILWVLTLSAVGIILCVLGCTLMLLGRN